MKKFLVTGCSSGLGRGLVQELVRRGNKVWGVARRGEALKQLAREIGSDRFSFSVCDVSRSEEVRQTVETMEKNDFIPDVVILNAGINPEASGSPFTMEMFEGVVKTNLFGALSWVEAFLPKFRTRRTGEFVAISSLAAYRGDARWVAYCASKAGLTRAFEAFRGRHAGEGITFLTIHLGAVEAGMGARARSPFRLTTDQAVQHILKAVESRGGNITIPFYLRLLLEATRILPDTIFSRLTMNAFSNTTGIVKDGKS